MVKNSKVWIRIEGCKSQNVKKELKPWNIPLYKHKSKKDNIKVSNKERLTSKGDTVKSRGEEVIAEFLSKNGIKYEYEKECLNDFGGKISNPDFYLPDFDVYIEFWGLIENVEYVKQMKFKMLEYHKHNIKFISIYPDNLDNFEWVFKKKFREVIGKELISEVKK